MDSESKVLIVDDDEMMLGYIKEALSSYSLYTAGNIQEAKQIAQNETVDLLITDIKMKGGSGIDLIRDFRSEYPTIPTIIITGYPNNEYIKTVEEMEVDTFLTKPFSPRQIRYTVLKGLEKRKRETENLKMDSLADGNVGLGLVGISQYISKLRKKIQDLARGEFPVLIQGPSGTGKEIVANAVHSCSSRKKNPIVTINCPAIPKDLEESEFFGHTRGAFTGAYSDRNGIIAAADNSTLFLDEVAELSLRVQAKLLRVLENGEYLRIGETAPRKVNIRLITATNRNLKEMTEQGAFREDLYFRLGIMVNTKPLMEHKEDIPVLVKHFVNMNFQSGSRYPNQITSDAMAYLVGNRWQGNVRELKQTVNHLCNTAIGKKRINIIDVNSIFGKKVVEICDKEFYSSEKSKVIKEFEIDYFTKLLKKYSGNISQAAKAAGMHRPNLIKKLKSLGISPGDFRIHNK